MTNINQEDFSLVSDLKVPVSFKVKKIERAHLPQFLGQPTCDFSQISLDEIVIDCQVWGGPFHISRTSELYCNTSHWLRTKDFQHWIQSRIQYAQLLSNTERPRIPPGVPRDIGRELLNYLSYERNLGPHIWFEIKVPTLPKAETSKTVPSSTILAVGVLPLYYHEESMTVRQGLQVVRLFPVGKSALQGAPDQYLQEDYIRQMEYKHQKLNELHRYQGFSWLDQQTRRRLESPEPIPVPNDFKYRGKCVAAPGVAVGLLIVELPRFSSENVFSHFTEMNVSHDKRINLPHILQFGEQSTNIQRRFDDKKISIKEKETYLSNIVCVQDHQLYCGYNNATKIPEPVEEKYRQLSWNMEPSLQEVQQMQRLIYLPLTYQLTEEDISLLWNYRKYLSSNSKALKRFLFAIRWNNEIEKKEALRLLKLWDLDDISVHDAIEILNICPEAPPEIYAFTIDILARTENLQYYLLELVQILKLDYQFLETRQQSSLRLFDILFDKAVKDFTFCNNFFWLLQSERSGEENTFIFKRFIDIFKERLRGLPKGELFIRIFEQQQNFISRLLEFHKASKPQYKSPDAHTNALRKMLEAFVFEEPLPFPMDPNIQITGFVLHECKVMNSNARPFRLAFRTHTGGCFMVLYKVGDDLRQDMFFLQMIQVIDLLLKSENFDLHLTPYRVLATSGEDGFIEFVTNSLTLREIEACKPDRILSYLREHNRDPTAPHGISPHAMNSFIRSCAGYSVITYLFGVGDRHKHNLMIRKNGDLFHIDFGFIFGKDPKPFPPPFKLSPSMVAAMEGKTGGLFKDFTITCCEAYNRVRSMGTIILALSSLMIGAGIEAIDEGIHTIRKLEDNFQFGLTDEAASLAFRRLIEASADSKAALISDIIHDFVTEGFSGTLFSFKQ